MDIDDEAYPKIRKPTSKWKCGAKGISRQQSSAGVNSPVWA
jgi:hypothetical protein